MLEAEVSKSGEVTVEGHVIGRLQGFEFAPDTAGAGQDAKALRAAAQKVLAVEIEARAAKFAVAPDEQFVLANDGVSLDLPPGEIHAIVGENGAGKTTLMRVLYGLTQPDGGEIQVDGQRIDAMSAGQLSHWRSQNVGFVFQFYNLMPTLNAQKNVELPLLLTRLSSAQRKRNAEIALQKQLGQQAAERVAHNDRFFAEPLDNLG